MELPDDPMMLFSMVNMKLRDCYHSLDELCDDMNVDKELLVKKLKAAGFEYSKENIKFWEIEGSARSGRICGTG